MDHIAPAEALVFHSMLNAKRQADLERRREARRRIDVYSDDFRDHLADLISTQFEKENRDELLKVLDFTNNPAKRIIREISTIYHEPATFKLDADDGGVWKGLLTRGLWPAVAQVVNEYTNLCNECLVHVVVRNGRLCFDVVTPDNVIVEQDPSDPTYPLAIAYWSGMENTTEQVGFWHYWSRKGETPVHAIYDQAGRDVSEKFGIDRVNPYKDESGAFVLPFVVYHRRLPISDVWDQTSGGDLIDGTLTVCALETWLNHLLRTDSIAQKWISGQLDVEAMGSQVGGTLRALLIRGNGGEAVSVGQFASQADWPGMRSNVNAKIAGLANGYGLSINDFQVSGDPASGFSLRVRKEGLLEIRRKQLPLYRAWDLDLYAKAAAVWNTEIKNTASSVYGKGAKPMLPPSKAKPEMVYASYQTELTVQEKQAEHDLNEKRMAKGLISVVDLYMREHPDATEAEAIAAIDNNKKLNGKNVDPAPQPGAPGAGSADRMAAIRARISGAPKKEE